MFQFITKYSPDYATNTPEGWSVILVVAAGFEISTLASNWPEMIGLFVTGVLCAHIVACIIKFLIINKKTSIYEESMGLFGLWLTCLLYGGRFYSDTARSRD